VAKVNSNASALIYAGYIGGSGDDFGRGIALDGSGNAYVTGFTDSAQTTFPVTGGPDTSYNGGSYDAFVVKVNSNGSALVYAGYIGGSGNDLGSGIAVDGSGNAYVTGDTDSAQTTFPAIGGPDTSYNGGTDAFVAKVNSNASALVYAGYIGGSGDDFGRGIALDGSGNAYVTGFTNSDQTTFPAIGGPDTSYNGDLDAFVAKVNSNGSALVYAGYIGGSGNDYGYEIAVDGSGNAYVTGDTYSDQTTFPAIGGPDTSYNGDRDAFVAKVNSNASALIYAGYIGGSGDDFGRGIALDGSGNAYVTGYTSSDQTTFPVTGGPDTSYNGGSYDAFVVKVVDTGNKVFLPAILNNYSPCFAGPLEQEPNNNGTQANGPLCLGQQYRGQPNDSNDYFYFNLDSAATVTVDLTNHIGQGLQLLLYYQTVGNIVGLDSTPPYHITLPNAQPGRYYILIYATGGYSDSPLYQLTINTSSSALSVP
jgi:hypothetical protein